jgi:putative NIF3 family GTP cyclohydrolase 1 type 2
MRRLVLALLVGIPFPLHSQANGITASAIVDRIRTKAGVEVSPQTVDRFKAGNQDATVKGVAVTMMATLEVLKEAAKRGDNFVITHEPTFYSHRDTTGGLEQESDAVLATKQKFIRDKGLIVWRFHDTPHAMKPDMVNAGVIDALGWADNRHEGSANVFDLPSTTLESLARMLKAKLGANAVKVSGDGNARVSRVVITHGFPGFAANRHALQGVSADVLVIGEDHEWETIEYAVDAISAGQLKGLIVLGHIPSEQAGMEAAAKWIRSFVTEVPVHFIPTRDPFRPLK